MTQRKPAQVVRAFKTKDLDGLTETIDSKGNPLGQLEQAASYVAIVVRSMIGIKIMMKCCQSTRA